MSTPTCPSCRSPRWVSVSLDGGYTRRAQCVPCGAYHKSVIGPGWKSPRFNDPDAEHPDYRKRSTMSDLIILVKFGDGRADWAVVRPSADVTYKDPSGSGSTVRRDVDGGIHADLKIPGSYIQYAMNSGAPWMPPEGARQRGSSDGR